MIPHKNLKNPGFSLIEVIIALAMISIIVITCLNVQSRIVTTTTRNTQLITRIAAIKELFITADQQQFIEKKSSHTISLAAPAPEITYSAKPVPKDSALSKIPQLFTETVTATTDNARVRMVRITFCPERAS